MAYQEETCWVNLKGFFSLDLEEWEFLEQTFSEAGLWELLGIQEHLWREELMEH